MDHYAKRVLKPKISEFSSSLIKEDEKLRDRNAEAQKYFLKLESDKKHMKDSHYQEIGSQIRLSNLKHSFDQTLYDNDKLDMQKNIHDNMQYEKMAQQEKSRKQKMYKDILNYQCQLNQKLRQQGGMTKIEKQINKRELHAYKHYENVPFRMIPGLNNADKFGYYRSPIQKMSTNFSTPNLFYSEEDIIDKNLQSRNSVNSNLTVALNKHHIKNFSHEKVDKSHLSNEYNDHSNINKTNFSRNGVKNLRSRGKNGDLLRNAAGDIIRSGQNYTPNGSPNRESL